MTGRAEQIATKTQSKILKASAPEECSMTQLTPLCSGDCLARTRGNGKMGMCAVVQPGKASGAARTHCLGNRNVFQSAGIWYYSLLDSSIHASTLIISPLCSVGMLCTSIVSFHYTTQGNFRFTDVFCITEPNPTKLNSKVLEISELNSSVSLSQLCKLTWTLTK